MIDHAKTTPSGEPLCRGCRHYKPTGRQCGRRVWKVDYVAGWHEYRIATFERQDSSGCGQKARYFEPKPKSAPIWRQLANLFK